MTETATPPTVLSVIGVRPQFVKHAPVSRALRRVAREIVVHTGQHYDFRMSRLFFDELGIPEPDHHLEIGSASHATQTALAAQRVEALVEELRPDAVLVFGDTNTTLGAALGVAKLPVLLAHVEAGVRTGVRKNTEELNRILVDHMSDVLFVPTESGMQHAAREAIGGDVHLVGDVMLDALEHFLVLAAERPQPVAGLGLEPGSYVLATLHRAENVDRVQTLTAILDGLAAIGEPVVFPVHPRTRAAIERHGLGARLAAAPQVHAIDPAGYLDMLLLEQHARTIVTDSGGVQKEAYLLGVPCVTVFPSSPWPETVEDGWNRLVAANATALAETVRGFRPTGERHDHYGDGHAAAAIARILVAAIEARRSEALPS